MNPIAQRLRSLAARTALDGIAEEMRAIADEIALAQQAQEPVAYMDDDVAAGVLAGSVLLSAAIRGAPGGTFNFPLYTRPQQAQEPWGWAIEDKHGVAQAIRPARKEFFGCIQATEPFTVEDVEKMGREWPGLAPHRIVNLYTTPPAPQVPAPAPQPASAEDIAVYDGIAKRYFSDTTPAPSPQPAAPVVPEKRTVDPRGIVETADSGYVDGWNACIDAILALRPAVEPMTDGVFDLICGAIDKADTVTMEGDYMMDSDDCIAVVRVMQALLSVRGITARAAQQKARE